MKRFYYYLPLILQKVGYLVFGLLYRVFLRVEIKGRENLVGLKKPVILAANHTNELDVTALPLILPFFSDLYPVYFVSNSKDRYKTFGWRSYIYGGVFFNILGGYSVFSGHQDYQIALENHIELLKNGQTVFIFPEGMRTRDGKMNPGRGGLGYMTHTTNATVVPVVIDTFYNLTWKEFFSFQRKISITILKPLNRDELFLSSNPSVEDFKNASQKVLNKMSEFIG